jgi:SARP family transcriptional regulator, regulator of embCAB operon
MAPEPTTAASATPRTTPTALRFGVLGPLAIWRGGRSSQVAAAKHRTVLAILLANANRTVHIDTLVDELWPEAAPDTARKTVQGYIWRLRRALGPFSGHLATVDSGYQVVLSADGLDALEFERSCGAARAAMASGSAAAAVEDLTRAVQLWRGPAFACVTRTPAIEAQAVRLDEALLTAKEMLIAARIELGQCREVVPDLVGLTAGYPHRESVHRQLMTALYHSGRRLDALEVFQRLQQRLAEEYGLDPDRETAELQQAILRDSVGSHRAGTAPRR